MNEAIDHDFIKKVELASVCDVVQIYSQLHHTLSFRKEIAKALLEYPDKSTHKELKELLEQVNQELKKLLGL